jgi:hypothetical protein
MAFPAYVRCSRHVQTRYFYTNKNKPVGNPAGAFGILRWITLIAFRVSEFDARLLDREFGEEAGPRTFTDLANFETRVRSLSGGKPLKPFTTRIMPPMGTPHKRMSGIVRRSREAYGTPRQRMEDRIARWQSGQ